MKSGSLNLLESLGSVEACNGIALPFYFGDIHAVAAPITGGKQQLAFLDSFWVSVKPKVTGNFFTVVTLFITLSIHSKSVPTGLYYQLNKTFFTAILRAILSPAARLFVTERNGTERSGAEQSRAEQSGAEQSRAEQNRTEQSRAEQNRTEQSRAEQIRRRSAAI